MMQAGLQSAENAAQDALASPGEAVPGAAACVTSATPAQAAQVTSIVVNVASGTNALEGAFSASAQGADDDKSILNQLSAVGVPFDQLVLPGAVQEIFDWAPCGPVSPPSVPGNAEPLECTISIPNEGPPKMPMEDHRESSPKRNRLPSGPGSKGRANDWRNGSGDDPRHKVSPEAKELEALKLSTLEHMRQEIDYKSGDGQWTCPFMYLTGPQATRIPRSKMPRIREVMGLTDHKMVIRLLPSYFGPMTQYTFPFQQSRFPCRQPDDVLGERLSLLAKEVLLPLAIKTEALIVGTDSCELALAFLRVAAPVQRNMGRYCPFKVLFFLRAPTFDLLASDNQSVIYNFKQNCPAWLQESENHSKARVEKYGIDEAFHPHGELIPGHYSVIMFESLSSYGTISDWAGDNFQNDFISSLADTHPVIGLQTLGAGMEAFTAVAAHTSQGMPLMILDSHDRSEHSKALNEVNDPDKLLDTCSNDLKELAKVLHARGRSDRHLTSTMSYIKAVIDRANNQKRDRRKPQKFKWIWEAIADKRQSEASVLSMVDDIIGGGGPTGIDDDLYMKATKLLIEQAGVNRAKEAELMREFCQENLDYIMNESTDWPAFAKVLQECWVSLRGICFFDGKELDAFAEQHHAWCEVEQLSLNDERPNGRRVLKIREDAVDAVHVDLKNAKEAFRELCQAEISKSKEYDNVHKSKDLYMDNQHMLLCIYSILKDPLVQTGSLADRKDCEKKLNILAKNIDRLPEENSLAALVLIRRAWTLVELFSGNATFYKLIAKSFYFLSLLTGLGIVVLHTVFTSNDWEITEKEQQYSLLGFALLMSGLNGLSTAFEPTKKWMQLRGGSLALEKEIWKFRTRVNEYSTSYAGLASYAQVGAERQAELKFQMFIQGIQEKVLQGASLMDTNFFGVATCTDDVHQDLPESDSEPGDAEDPQPFIYRSYKSKRSVHPWRRKQHGNEVGEALDRFGRSKNCWVRLMNVYYGHHQYKKGDEKGYVRKEKKKDNYHSPSSPHDYIRFRLMPAKRFYERRIPTYACRRRLFQIVALIASLTGALLAAIEYHHWTTIVANVAGVFAAWQEYTGATKKLERYSYVVSALEHVMMWWQALPTVEHNIVSNVEALVERTESLLASDHAAWLSDAQKHEMRRNDIRKQGDINAGQVRPAAASPPHEQVDSHVYRQAAGSSGSGASSQQQAQDDAPRPTPSPRLAGTLTRVA